MAFKTSAENKSSARSGIPANKKAAGFINLYLPTKSGGKRKLGTIILREAYANEATLAEWLSVDPVARAEKILSQLILDYNDSTPDESSAFALPEDVPAGE